MSSESWSSCAPRRSRSRSPRLRPDRSALDLFFQRPESRSCIRKLRYDLLDLEEETTQKAPTCHGEESLRNFWRQQKRLVASKVEEALANLLKDFPGINCTTFFHFQPVDIARELGCCILQARSSRGRDIGTQNSEYSLENHRDMVSDRVRVDAFWDAISRAVSAVASSESLRVLDVGSGAFCFLSRMALAAGAKEVYAVEVNDSAWHHATQLFQAEVQMFRSDSEEIDQEVKKSLNTVRRFPLISDSVVEAKQAKQTLKETEPCYTVMLSHGVDRRGQSKLVTKCASSFSATLEGPFQLVTHEILGHIASAEGVIETIKGLLRKGLCSSNCLFIPRAAGTLFAPTSPLQLSDLEKVLNAHFNGGVGILPQVKYHARCFDRSSFLAPPQPFEWFEFGKSDFAEKRRVIFVTDKDGYFNGLHFHLLIDLDEATSIDTLRDETTWSTTYVRLLEDALWLPCGTRMVCDCEAKQRRNAPMERIQCYSVKVLIGEPWDEREVASFVWEGCT